MFSMDGPLWRALNFIADVMVLHVLWLVHSLPLVTIGASTTALYYAMMKRIPRRSPWPICPRRGSCGGLSPSWHWAGCSSC